jgi:uncharacterized protein (DUF3084 family)
MKNIIGFIILIVVCLGLGIALITIKKQAADQQALDEKTIQSFSNNLASTTKDLDEQRNVSSELQKDLATQKKNYEKNYEELTNNFVQVSGNLAKTEASLEASQQEVAKRDAKITELENENQSLDRRASELTNAISSLNVEIAETQRKLASAEGDKAFLSKELKRMMADLNEYQRQFNDLTIVKAQLSKLKDQMIMARRLEWARTGVYAAAEQKGAQRLMTGLKAAPHEPERPNYDLNVEIRSDGTTRVIPPLTNGVPSSTGR